MPRGLHAPRTHTHTSAARGATAAAVREKAPLVRLPFFFHTRSAAAAAPSTSSNPPCRRRAARARVGGAGRSCTSAAGCRRRRLLVPARRATMSASGIIIDGFVGACFAFFEYCRRPRLSSTKKQADFPLHREALLIRGRRLQRASTSASRSRSVGRRPRSAASRWSVRTLSTTSSSTLPSERPGTIEPCTSIAARARSQGTFMDDSKEGAQGVPLPSP